jgi:hypothetical protein
MALGSEGQLYLQTSEGEVEAIYCAKSSFLNAEFILSVIFTGGDYIFAMVFFVLRRKAGGGHYVRNLCTIPPI